MVNSTQDKLQNSKDESSTPSESTPLQAILETKFRNAGIPVHSVTKYDQNSLHITLRDADPETHFKADQLVKPHEQNYYNKKDPETPNTSINIYNEMSLEMKEEIAEFAFDEFPDFVERDDRDSFYTYNLFNGFLPQFWQSKSKTPFATRCTHCRGPIENTKAAAKNRRQVSGDALTYRHQKRGNCDPEEDVKIEAYWKRMEAERQLDDINRTVRELNQKIRRMDISASVTKIYAPATHKKTLQVNMHFPDGTPIDKLSIGRQS